MAIITNKQMHVYAVEIEDERDVTVAKDGTTMTVLGVPPHVTDTEVVQRVRKVTIYRETRSGEALRASWLPLLASPRCLVC